MTIVREPRRSLRQPQEYLYNKPLGPVAMLRPNPDLTSGSAPASTNPRICEMIYLDPGAAVFGRPPLHNWPGVYTTQD